MATKDRIKEKIEALLSKTVDNGCTEDEALAAAEKAAQLMLQYEIEVGEIGLRRDAATCKAIWVPYAFYGRRPIGGGVAVGAAELFGCRVWATGKQVCFFGLAQDAECAARTFQTITAAMLAEMARFKNSETYRTTQACHGTHGKSLMISFLAGMGRRLYARLVELKNAGDRARNAAAAGGGTSLVVVKEAIVSDELAKLGLRIGAARKSRTTLRSHSAFSAGAAAGDRVALNKSVAGGRLELGVE